VSKHDPVELGARARRPLTSSPVAVRSHGHNVPIICSDDVPPPPSPAPSSVAEVAEGACASVGYLPGESTALVSYLATKLGKAGARRGAPAGVGKTELAKALAKVPRPGSFVRLQCYEGLDEAKALYEWNYRKQLLRIQA